MARPSIQERLNSAFTTTKKLHKFDFKASWFYVRVNGVANSIIIARTDVEEISGIVKENKEVTELAMLAKDIYLFGRATANTEKEQPTCYYKNEPCYGDIFLGCKIEKKIHPMPFSDAIANIEKLQFVKKSDKAISVVMI